MTGLFALPEALWALLLVPIAWLGLRALDSRRALRMRTVAGERASTASVEVDRRTRRARRALTIAALTLASLALAQPRWGHSLQQVEQRGVDLLVCLDVSRSMLARDLPPSRLERAHDEIGALTQRTRGDRLGLIAFAGEARLIVPLTRDLASFAELVAATDPLTVRRGGTDLGAALEVALTTFEGTSGKHEAVLLITDGEDHERQGLQVARACAERNITVHCVGLGSTLGSKIAVQDDGNEVFLRDPTGQDVISVLNAPGLRRIAEATGGGYVDATLSPRPILEIYETRIVPMARKAFAAEERQQRKNRFQWPLLLALLLWMLELGMTDRRKR